MRIVSVMLAGAFAFGCTESPETSTPIAQEFEVGAAHLNVPAGAAPANFVATIEPVAEAPAWADSIIPGTLHQFGPHGTQFDAPVALTFTYDPAMLGNVRPENLRVVWLDPDGQRLETIGVTVDPATRTVRGETNHFSMFAAAPMCAADADCAAGERCIEGGCEAPPAGCDDDADCGAGEYCEDNGRCLPEVCAAVNEVPGNGIDDDCDGEVDEGGAVECDADNPCPADQECLGGQCEFLVGPCNQDAECGAGQVCQNGECVEGAADCAQDADCAPGQICNGGQCGGGEPQPEVCGDGIDNDMDGIVDEDCDACAQDADCGPAEICENGQCVDGAHAGAEVCGDGIDNDGDGFVDEDCDIACGADADCPPGTACIDGVCGGAPADDADGDGVLDIEDNCPLVANGDQTDTDGDGAGDACDDDDVDPEICGDGIDNDRDGFVDEDCGLACAENADCPPGSACIDGICGGGAPADDADGDGVPDVRDNCPNVPNPDQADADGDGAGDACDAGGIEPEICEDGIDNDADGAVDEDCDAIACGADADCGPGQVCFDGICVD